MTPFVVRTDDAAWIDRNGATRAAADPTCVIVQVPEEKIERFSFAGKEHLRARLADCPADIPNPWVVCAQMLIDRYVA